MIPATGGHDVPLTRVPGVYLSGIECGTIPIVAGVLLVVEKIQTYLKTKC